MHVRRAAHGQIWVLGGLLSHVKAPQALDTQSGRLALVDMDRGGCRRDRDAGLASPSQPQHVLEECMPTCPNLHFDSLVRHRKMRFSQTKNYLGHPQVPLLNPQTPPNVSCAILKITTLDLHLGPLVMHGIDFTI